MTDRPRLRVPPRSTAVLDTCIGVCPRCGGEDRVFVETGSGILSHCYSCGDESHADHRPITCWRGDHHGDHH